MSAPIDTGGPAFPVPGDQPHVQMNGMSLRDWFAGQALAGLYASWPHDCDQHGLAHDAYLAADAMMKARQTSNGLSVEQSLRARLSAAISRMETIQETHPDLSLSDDLDYYRSGIEASHA